MERQPNAQPDHSLDISKRDRPRTHRNGGWVMKWGIPNSDDEDVPVNNWGRAVRPLTGFTGALKKESKDGGGPDMSTGWIPPPSAVVRKPGLRRNQGAALQKRYPAHLLPHVEPDASAAIPLLVSELPGSSPQRQSSEQRSQSHPAMISDTGDLPVREKANYYKKVVPVQQQAVITPAKRRSHTSDKLDNSMTERRSSRVEQHTTPSTTRSVSAPSKERETNKDRTIAKFQRKMSTPKVATKPWVPAPWNAGAGHKLRGALSDGHTEPTPVKTKKVSSDRQPYLFDRDEPITGWDNTQDYGDVDQLRGIAEPQWKQKPQYNNEDRLMVRSIIDSVNQLLIDSQPSLQPLPSWISQSSDVRIVSTPPIQPVVPIVKPPSAKLDTIIPEHSDPVSPEEPPKPAAPILYTISPEHNKPKKITVDAPPVWEGFFFFFFFYPFNSTQKHKPTGNNKMG